MDVQLIFDHFPHLTDLQKSQFEQLDTLYHEWNAKINVISRKDIDRLYERHVLHSLGIAKVMSFADDSSIYDIGTGGGFPGIPLAILFPNCQFHLVDSIAKKIKVVQAIVEALGLSNVKAEHLRAEKSKNQYDFIVSRAVTALPKMMPWVRDKIKKKQINPLPNGLLLLKGGDLSEELKGMESYTDSYPLSKYFEGDFFETKQVIWVGL